MTHVSTPLQQIDRTFVRLNGRKLSYFAGCDYFRMSSHPAVLNAAASALKKFGLNVSASRMTTGNHELYGRLENALEEFFDVESATLASNGYAPNLMVAQALAGEYSQVFIDERAHGCLTDAALLMGCPIVKFKHLDADDLARALKRAGKGRALLMTDGMFSNNGAIAPLKKYLKILPSNGTLLLDDAHGAGVLGRNGHGTPELCGVNRSRIIQTITLSKGFGVYGGAVLGPKSLREAILKKSRLFVGNTPLPLPLANAAIKSIALLKSDRSRNRLNQNIAFVKNSLVAAGKSIPNNSSPIVALIPSNETEANDLKTRLLAKNIFPPFIKYLGGPENGYFRFAISSEHTKKQLGDLVAALAGK